jgi:hypothetical protein
MSHPNILFLNFDVRQVALISSERILALVTFHGWTVQRDILRFEAIALNYSLNEPGHTNIARILSEERRPHNSYFYSVNRVRENV